MDTNVANVADVDAICSELVPEARFWRDALGFVASEMEANAAEMLAVEDCDAVGSPRKEGDMVPDSEFRLLEVVVEAMKSINMIKFGLDRKAAYLTSFHYD